jgi:hypothetical protein
VTKEDAIPKDKYNKAFADEVSSAKKKAAYNFHKSKIPFDVSNIPPEQFQKLIVYFESATLGQSGMRK